MSCHHRGKCIFNAGHGKTREVGPILSQMMTFYIIDPIDTVDDLTGSVTAKARLVGPTAHPSSSTHYHRKTSP